MHYKNSEQKIMNFVVVFCIYFFSISPGFSRSNPTDSVGIEKLGNKTYILHKIDPKETLFSLAKRYNVKVDQIEIENPEVREGIKIGQILRIPYQPKSSVSSVSPNVNSHSGGAKTHVVGQGQTLYSISRMYNVKVDDIKKWNGLTSNELNVGQEISVSAASGEARPTQAPQKVDSGTSGKVNSPKNLPNFRYDGKGNKIHITEGGQTLFSISQIYNVSMDDVRKWNGLSSNEISTGQEIIVEKVKDKEEEKPKNEEVKERIAVTPKTNNPNTGVQQPPTTFSTSPAAEAPKTPERAPEIAKASSNASGFNKVIERGLAESIEESGDTPKFQALHKTASYGTIIQVKNELNNLYIFAKVIGKLPQTAVNDKLVIKLSKKAYEKLGAVDKRFPVEVSYVPNN